MYDNNGSFPYAQGVDKLKAEYKSYNQTNAPSSNRPVPFKGTNDDNPFNPTTYDPTPSSK